MQLNAFCSEALFYVDMHLVLNYAVLEAEL